MHQSLTVQKTDTFHHIKCYKQPAFVLESTLDALIEIPLKPVHNQQNSRGTTSSITVINHWPYDGHKAVVFWNRSGKKNNKSEN